MMDAKDEVSETSESGSGNGVNNNINCINLYFSEWKYVNKAQKIILLFKLIAIIILICVLIFGDNLDTRLLPTNATTYRTIIAMIIWILLTLGIFTVYIPHQQRIFPLWWKILINIIFGVIVIFFLMTFLFMDIWPDMPTDDHAFDLWTIVHTLWGVWLSWIVPVYWVCLLSSTWEILEAYTKGLGQSESVDNHLVDVFSVIFGYFVVILIFTSDDIPWITAKRGVEQCCCFVSCLKKNQHREEVSDDSDAHQGLMSDV